MIMFMAVVVILIAGMFLQASPLIVMILPILTPVVASVGWDLIQFGIIACIADVYKRQVFSIVILINDILQDVKIIMDKKGGIDS